MINKKCRHKGTWLIDCDDNGCHEWCWECGALRYLKKVKGCNAYTPQTYWQRPGGIKGRNPAIMRDRPLKLLNRKTHLTTTAARH